MVSAEYGGTGGDPLEGGMCVEEPDIEIGQGVSSKGVCDCFFIFIFLYLISIRCYKAGNFPVHIIRYHYCSMHHHITTHPHCIPPSPPDRLQLQTLTCV